MTCYQISQSGEPVALVENLALAERIAGCQAPGFYQVEEIQVDGPDPRWRSQPARHRRASALGAAGSERHDRPPQRRKDCGTGRSFVTRTAPANPSKT